MSGTVKPTEMIARLTRERDQARRERDELQRRLEKWQQNETQFATNQQVARLIRERDEARAEVEQLRKCCTQRGARMQIMREWLDSNRGLGPPTEWWYFCEERPEARDWFDEDGVPVT